MRRRVSTRRYPRTARVNEVVLEVIADELERLSDPRLGFVTLTGVTVSPDLRAASVYYSSLGQHGEAATPEAAEQTAAALESAAPHLRAVLGRQVRLKYLPRLSFTEDPAIAGGQRVEEILVEIHRRERAAGRIRKPAEHRLGGQEAS